MTTHSENQTAIADLVHGYADLVRMKRGGQCGRLFCEDATYELCEIDRDDLLAQPRRRWLLEGRSAIEDYVGRATQSDMQIRPEIQDLIVEIDGDMACSTCLMTSHTVPPGPGTFGRYEDSYRREAGEWRFQARIYTIILSGKGGSQ
ncbi:MAG: nuclear transport factor 2 family protein [Sphingobium sp.]